MRARLIAATRRSLMDQGYGRTTAVEVCARAGVTRGALFHHFADLSELFAATLDEVCRDIGERARDAAPKNNLDNTLVAYIDFAWRLFEHPDFKIVIEIWLAARNDTALRKSLHPVIERIRRVMTPEINPELASRVGRDAKDVAFYRLILEAMIGMALGRAVTPGSRPLGHEEDVVSLLKKLARVR